MTENKKDETFHAKLNPGTTNQPSVDELIFRNKETPQRQDNLESHESPHVRESGIRNPANFCCWNPESRDWNPESTMVWNPESTTLVWNLKSKGLQSRIHMLGSGI